MKDTFINNRLYQALAACILLFVLSYSWSFLYIPAWVALGTLALIVCIDWHLLFQNKEDIFITREVDQKLSLSDSETIRYKIINDSEREFNVELYDELPYQLQHRQGLKKLRLDKKPVEFDYLIRPYERGEYHFGQTHLYISNPKLNLLQRRISIANETVSQVVPSIKQMKKYELQVFSQTSALSGIRKTRQIGENDEFEHIRPYTQGDNVKAINWKATSRSNQIMVNQYQNSRHQSVYCVIDKGRSMKMPFGNLTLLDHSINSALALSNIILRKYDHAGLITFSNKIGAILKATAKKGQLENIAEVLYNQTTDFNESNFKLLSEVTRRQINRRSIWLFYTNFETEHDLNRHLPHLRYLAKRHLLVVIIFINTKLEETSEMECKTKYDIYLKTFAEKVLLDKQLIKEKLVRNGIQTILTTPQNLSVNVINRYLEIKSKRMK